MNRPDLVAALVLLRPAFDVTIGPDPDRAGCWRVSVTPRWLKAEVLDFSGDLETTLGKAIRYMREMLETTRLRMGATLEALAEVMP